MTTFKSTPCPAFYSSTNSKRTGSAVSSICINPWLPRFQKNENRMAGVFRSKNYSRKTDFIRLAYVFMRIQI
jgi:hypothetical protein